MIFYLHELKLKIKETIISTNVTNKNKIFRCSKRNFF